jgi:hydrogenase maturation protease
MGQLKQAVGAGKTLVIGIGNEYRHDDAVGLIVARRLSESPSGNFTVLEHNGDGAALMETWKGVETVIVVDAVHSGAEAGAVRRFDVSHQPLPAETFRGSTHAFSLVEAVELSRTLNQLPSRFIVYGIEGQDFQAGSGLSDEVEKAVPHAAQRVLQEICAQGANSF